MQGTRERAMIGVGAARVKPRWRTGFREGSVISGANAPGDQPTCPASSRFRSEHFLRISWMSACLSFQSSRSASLSFMSAGPSMALTKNVCA